MKNTNNEQTAGTYIRMPIKMWEWINNQRVKRTNKEIIVSNQDIIRELISDAMENKR